MKKFTFVFVLFLCLVFVFPLLAFNNYENTIPPEILKQFDSAIISGEKPKIITITQPMIWSLRNQPNQGGDVYNFDLDLSKISSVQMEIIKDWISNGAKIFLWGVSEVEKYLPLFKQDNMSFSYNGGEGQLTSHVVNTDVKDLQFDKTNWGWGNIDILPINSELIVTNSRGTLAGRIPYGRGSIYFATTSNHWHLGKDRDRWTLNFYQWMLGGRIPGATNTAVGAGISSSSLYQQIEPQDRILLKNGDVISGKLLTEKFTLRTSYASIDFESKLIESIILEGSGQNIEMIVLKTGDKLSGIISPEIIKIKLQGEQEAAIEKDKIKEIVIQ